MKKLFIVISRFCLVSCFILLMISPSLTVASAFEDGLKATAGKTGHTGASSSEIWKEGNLPGAIGKLIGGVLALLGVIFLILMIYGGFTWMLARGNETETEKAKKIITDSIIGLIIVLGAYAITVFIGTGLTPKV